MIDTDSVSLTEGDLSENERRAVLEGAGAAAPTDLRTYAVDGPGAVSCVQGILTNDVQGPGDRSTVYGAVLTPKGMIESDLWVAREAAERILLFVPERGVSVVEQIMQRYFPPRLAKTTDVTADTAWIHIVGPEAVSLMTECSSGTPDAGRLIDSEFDGIPVTIHRTPLDRPFAYRIQCAVRDRDSVFDHLTDCGIRRVGPLTLELARIAAGWPTLEAELTDKTLPQEVRFDENDGVSYTKGCYTGQETVARLHFRGHSNRRLVGLVWADRPTGSDKEIVIETRAVGRVTSTAWLSEGTVGLAILRREVELGTAVTVAGAVAEVVDLPFDL